MIPMMHFDSSRSGRKRWTDTDVQSPRRLNTSSSTQAELRKGQRASSLIGNQYTGSIFLALDVDVRVGFGRKQQPGQSALFGLCGYGSGAKAKVFEGKVSPRWREVVSRWHLFERLGWSSRYRPHHVRKPPQGLCKTTASLRLKSEFALWSRSATKALTKALAATSGSALKGSPRTTFPQFSSNGELDGLLERSSIGIRCVSTALTSIKPRCSSKVVHGVPRGPHFPAVDAFDVEVAEHNFVHRNFRQSRFRRRRVC